MAGGIVVKNSPYVLGIDLGTSTSSVAIFHKGVSEIIKIGGQKFLPSVVHVRDNGDILVGQQAKSKTLVDPANTVSSVKREMGDSTWEKEFTGVPGRKFSPAEISAEILKALVNGVQSTDQLDLRGSPKYAVICVPANFDDKKKQMTLEAGQLANLEVLHLLEEPVAAAIAYGCDKNRDQTILVYDLGGGTFDVSVLEVDTTSASVAAFRVKAKEGIPKLGGDDFDQKIMELVNEKFKVDSGMDIFDLKKDQGVSAKHLREAQQKLKEAAEGAKKELSVTDTALIEIPNLIKDESGTVHNIDMEITRAQFEAAITDLIVESRGAVEKALLSAGITIEEISRIVLVGGSTRIPLIKTMLFEMFGKEPYADMDQDVIVAIGAAVYGNALITPVTVPEADETAPDGGLPQEDRVGKSFIVDNKVTHNLGIEVYGGKFSKLIEKNTELPHDNPVVSNTRTYATPRDNTTDLAIVIFQATDDIEYVTDPGAVCIGELFMTGIPPAPSGEEKITVTFRIDAQNLLKIEATSLGKGGATKTLEIRRM